MKKNSNLIVILSSLLIVLGVILGSVLTEYSNQISTIVTTITAIIGAVALWVQFKKDREINQASFIVEFYKTFYEMESNTRILDILDRKYSNLEYDDLSDPKYYSDILNYIYWIRTLCNLIDRNVVTFDTIDEMFSYKFFIVTNNKIIQELELEKYGYLYKLIYRTHKKWSQYRQKNNIAPINPEEDLSKVKSYEELCK